MKYKVQLILEDGTEKFLTLEEELAQKLAQMLASHSTARVSNQKGEFVMVNLAKVVAINIMAQS